MIACFFVRTALLRLSIYKFLYQAALMTVSHVAETIRLIIRLCMPVKV
jgi:hypothetical protein